jgi:hypothetical protein
MGQTEKANVVAGVGPCVVGGRRRSAVIHLVINLRDRQVAAVVCEHCERETRIAPYFLSWLMRLRLPKWRTRRAFCPQ